MSNITTNQSYLQNKFYNIVEKIVLYLNTIYSNDIEYQNEYINPAFNCKYICRKIGEFLGFIHNIHNMNKYNNDIINIIKIIDEEIPDRLNDDYYYKIVEELEEYDNCNQDDYFEEYESEENTRTINFNFRYDANVINYLNDFIGEDRVKEYIETILENLLIVLK